jgi:hypothetical protein
MCGEYVLLAKVVSKIDWSIDKSIRSLTQSLIP